MQTSVLYGFPTNSSVAKKKTTTAKAEIMVVELKYGTAVKEEMSKQKRRRMNREYTSENQRDILVFDMIFVGR